MAQQLRLLEFMALWTRRCAVDPPPKRRLRRGGPEADIWDRLYFGDLSHQSPNTRASTLELLRLLDEKGEDGKDVADVAESAWTCASPKSKRMDAQIE